MIFPMSIFHKISNLQKNICVQPLDLFLFLFLLYTFRDGEGEHKATKMWKDIVHFIKILLPGMLF